MYFGTAYLRRKHKDTWKFLSSFSSFTCVGSLALTRNIKEQVAFLYVWGEMIWDKLMKSLGMRDCLFMQRTVFPYTHFLFRHTVIGICGKQRITCLTSSKIFFFTQSRHSWRFLPSKVTASHSTVCKRVKRNDQEAEVINGVEREMAEAHSRGFPSASWATWCGLLYSTMPSWKPRRENLWNQEPKGIFVA